MHVGCPQAFKDIAVDIFCRNVHIYLQENTSNAMHMIEIGKSLNNSKDLDGKEMSWIAERVKNLENQYGVFSTKLDSRKKKLSQGMEFYRLFEKVSVKSLTAIYLSLKILSVFHFYYSNNPHIRTCDCL